MTIVLLTLAWVALLFWALGLLSDDCPHANLKGVANYYDHDLHCFVHLKGCEDCGESFITWER